MIMNKGVFEDRDGENVRPGRNKYNVKKDATDRTYGDTVFDSSVEMKFYRDVVIPRLQDKTIVRCERQKRYTLQPQYTHNGKKILPIEYKADFYIVDAAGKETVIDIKGFPDAVALLKRKMFWYLYPNIEYVWVSYSRTDGGWCTYEKILEGRRQRKKMKLRLKGEQGNEIKENN